MERLGLFFEYENVNGNLINYKSLSFNKIYSNKIDEELKNRFTNTFKFSHNDINKFIMLLRKGVYLYAFMDDWENFNESHYQKKNNFIVT